ncbi:hypothetical protein EJ04DRAFT_13605 [Polyplosphaeria fusca]|uniref:HTH psq-type domain-containing protein n=1 Tax=Polyplosphaeria fusca TaxID=682080 RepID=A0A9P4QTW7_9PLEO|nr:hypothetical protein EJ04DRAFT_13605 [Polyplosphaeria fusca]
MPPPEPQQPSHEARVLLAIQAYQKGQFRTVHAAAATYNASRTTINRRLAGVMSREKVTPNLTKLIKLTYKLTL